LAKYLKWLRTCHSAQWDYQIYS